MRQVSGGETAMPAGRFGMWPDRRLGRRMMMSIMARTVGKKQ